MSDTRSREASYLRQHGAGRVGPQTRSEVDPYRKLAAAVVLDAWGILHREPPPAEPDLPPKSEAGYWRKRSPDKRAKKKDPTSPSAAGYRWVTPALQKQEARARWNEAWTHWIDTRAGVLGFFRDGKRSAAWCEAAGLDLDAVRSKIESEGIGYEPLSVAPAEIVEAYNTLGERREKAEAKEAAQRQPAE